MGTGTQRMHFRLIDCDAQRRAAVTEVTQLWEQAEDSGGEVVEALAPLIEAYESTHGSNRSPDVVDAILFRMEQLGLLKRRRSG